ncbi:protein imuA [Phenylobacterium sp.]|uniref:protein imuA n=1 Tax=Phenylobacterium sp. TaxID=1871053 RepID=UPI0025D5C91A|nr:protein imuA [Phenylobacterium sp.]
MTGFRSGRLAAVRAKIAAIEAGGRGDSESLALGDPRVDRCLPGGRGLPLNRWHELGGEGLEAESAAAPAAFAALLARPLLARGRAVWIVRRDDLHVPGLLGLGLPGAPIEVWTPDEAQALAAAEDALSTRGVAAVFVEAEAVDLVAGRRLQRACEKGRATGFLIRRRPFGGKARALTGSAAATRWTVAPAPSQPPPGRLGLGAPRFRAALERSRGGRPGAWLFESPDAYLETEIQDGTHPLRLVAELGDRQLAPAQPAAREDDGADAASGSVRRRA